MVNSQPHDPSDCRVLSRAWKSYQGDDWLVTTFVILDHNSPCHHEAQFTNPCIIHPVGIENFNPEM